jgi:Protein of unknown function (DUF2490)
MKLEKRLMICFIALILSIQFIFAQQNNSLMWNTIQVPFQISKKWQIHNDISHRFLISSGTSYQYTIRTGIRRIFNKKWNAASGVALFYTRTSMEKANHEFGREFRLWQEVVNEKKINKELNLVYRLRLDERFFAATSARKAIYATRFRFRIALIQTLSEKWKLQIANEYMQQLSHKTFSFQQNRLGAAGIYVFNGSTQLQAGYMWSKLPTSTLHYVTCTFIKTLHSKWIQ